MQGKKHFLENSSLHFSLVNAFRLIISTAGSKTTLIFNGCISKPNFIMAKKGQQSTDPVVFFKLILIGYLEDFGSDRRIINTVSMRLDMLYFIGYDIDEQLPWHSTLSRTRLQTDKAKRLKKVRSSTVEPVLGTLINYMNMRRVNTRGIRQANKCMLMAAVAYNLKKN